jgi:hypothetical protein
MHPAPYNIKSQQMKNHQIGKPLKPHMTQFIFEDLIQVTFKQVFTGSNVSDFYYTLDSVDEMDHYIETMKQ